MAQTRSSRGRSQSGRTKRGRGLDDDGWGGFKNYMDAKKQKLAEQFHRDSENAIFAGVSVYVNGYTKPSSDVLRRMLCEHGGQYKMYLSKTGVTHVVASNLPNSKFKLAHSLPVVKPDWITDSVAAGRRLSHVPYLLLGNQSILQPGLKSFPSMTSLTRSSSTSSTKAATLNEISASHKSTDETKESQALELSNNGSFQTNDSDPIILKTNTEVNMNQQTSVNNDTKESVGAEERTIYPSQHENLNIINQKEEAMPEANQNQELSKSTFFKGFSEKIEDMRKDDEGKDDDDDSDIVYNSEEDVDDSDHILDHIRQKQKSDCKKSRIYKIRKSSTGSYGSPRKEDSNSCDSFTLLKSRSRTVTCPLLSPAKDINGRLVKKSFTHERRSFSDIFSSTKETDPSRSAKALKSSRSVSFNSRKPHFDLSSFDSSSYKDSNVSGSENSLKRLGKDHVILSCDKSVSNSLNKEVDASKSTRAQNSHNQKVIVKNIVSADENSCVDKQLAENSGTDSVRLLSTVKAVMIRNSEKGSVPPSVQRESSSRKTSKAASTSLWAAASLLSPSEWNSSTKLTKLPSILSSTSTSSSSSLFSSTSSSSKPSQTIESFSGQTPEDLTAAHVSDSSKQTSSLNQSIPHQSPSKPTLQFVSSKSKQIPSHHPHSKDQVQILQHQSPSKPALQFLSSNLKQTLPQLSPSKSLVLQQSESKQVSPQPLLSNSKQTAPQVSPSKEEMMTLQQQSPSKQVPQKSPSKQSGPIKHLHFSPSKDHLMILPQQSLLKQVPQHCPSKQREPSLHPQFPPSKDHIPIFHQQSPSKQVPLQSLSKQSGTTKHPQFSPSKEQVMTLQHQSSSKQVPQKSPSKQPEPSMHLQFSPSKDQLPILQHQSPSKEVPQQSASKQPSSLTTQMAKAGDKSFLSEFYSNSRLHHISTWGAEFKAYVAQIQKSGSTFFPGRDKLRELHVSNARRLGLDEVLETSRHGTADRTIMHIDMDCFFVSVGLLSRPDLRGQPVAVTHSKGQGGQPTPGSDAAWEKAEWHRKRDGNLKVSTGSAVLENDDASSNSHGYNYDAQVPKGSTGAQVFHSMAEIASCSYEARKAGVKNGMFMGRAKTLCPNLKTVPYNFSEYNRISRILYDVVASYTHDIEAVSCDEMFIDCTDLLTDTGATALEFAQLLRAEMEDKTGCTASAGIGPNILLARLATRKAKPNGQFEVLKSEAKEFIKDQAVSDLPGVGYSLSRKLAKLKVSTCGDLQAIPVSVLRREFGPKTGESLHRYSLGEDNRQVKGDKQRKSVSAEVNYGIRFTKESEAVAFLQELSQEVKRRLDAINVKGRSINLKLMIRRPDAPTETAKFMGHGICNTFNKSSNLPTATNNGDLIAREVVSLYQSQRVNAADIRGIGIQINKLESTDGSNGPVKRDSFGANLQSILSFTATGSRNAGSSSTANSVPDKRSESERVVVSGPQTSDGKRNVVTNSFLQPGTSNSFKGSVQPKPGPSREPSNPEETENLGVDWSNLSVSQIDTNVLEELPPDIAQEIMADIERRKQLKQQQQHSIPIDAVAPTSEPLAPPTHGLTPVNQDVVRQGLPSPILSEETDREQEAGSSLSSESSLPNLSQIDMSCFQALPKNVQQELRAEYAKQEMTSQRSVQKLAALEQGKTAQTDTFKVPKRRRGRPPGKKNAPAVTNQHKKSVKTAHKQIQSRRNPAVPLDGQVMLLDDDVREKDQKKMPHDGGRIQIGERLDSSSHSSENAAGSESEPSRHVKRKEVTFCGAKNLSDVRQLLKEWLGSGTAPQSEDIQLVREYLTALIESQNLEQVYCLVKFLIRKVRKSRNFEWISEISEVCGYVQSLVYAIYGAMLKLEPP